MIGDLQQLAPVVTEQDAQLISKYYDTPFFFGSRALQQTPYVTIELKQVYRQSDEQFLHLLNSIREGRASKEIFEKLNQRYQPDFRPKEEEGYIRLTTHNNMAQQYNEQQLERLSTPAHTFQAKIEGTFPEYAYPTDTELMLKEGAQVMFVKNDPTPAHAFFNGKIGHVTKITSKGITVRCPDDDFDIEVEPMEWENAKYVLNEKTKEIETEIQGTFSQYPLRLAWAITIHKSQGLTFERAIIDASLSFASGQVYVALSRCKSLEAPRTGGVQRSAHQQLYLATGDRSGTQYQSAASTQGTVLSGTAAGVVRLLRPSPEGAVDEQGARRVFLPAVPYPLSPASHRHGEYQ